MKIQLIDKNIGTFTKWLGIYFLCLPLGAMNIGSIGSALRILAFVPVLIWFLKSHSINLNYLVKNSLIFVLVCCLSIIWSISTSASISRSVSHLTFLLMLMAVSGYLYTKEEIDYLKRCLIWSSRATAVISLAFGGLFQGRLYLSGVLSEDPNYLCAYFIFAIAIDIITLLSANTKKTKKIVSVFELAIYIYIIFATGSRGGLLAVATASVIVLFFYSEKNGAIGLTLLKKIIICCCIGISLVFVLSYLPENIAMRFTANAIMESNGTGRYDLWEDAINAFKSFTFPRQLVGYGTGSANALTYVFPFRRHNVMHNTFIENLIEIGCIGLLSYIVYIGSFIYGSIIRRDLYSFAVISGMVVLSFSTSLYSFKPYWNIMFYILCVHLQYFDGCET